MGRYQWNTYRKPHTVSYMVTSRDLEDQRRDPKHLILTQWDSCRVPSNVFLFFLALVFLRLNLGGLLVDP